MEKKNKFENFILGFWKQKIIKEIIKKISAILKALSIFIFKGEDSIAKQNIIKTLL